MQINAINNNIPARIHINVRSGNNNIKGKSIDTPQKVYASNLCFRGGAPLTALINDYKWFINCDKIPAINSFLKLEAPKDALESVLRFILGHDEYSYQLIESITANPREINNIYNNLRNKININSDLLNLFYPTNPYFTAYKKYTDKKLFEAKSISELLKIRPDWSGDVLLKKYQELYHNNHFELGKIPESIGQENYQQIIEYLSKYNQYGLKYEETIQDLSIGNKIYKFKNCIDGRSDKNVFQVEVNDGNKFVIKIAKPENRSLDDSFALGTCCKIDSYLTLNGCRNTAPFKYYNHENNSAIYDYIEHFEVDNLGDVSREFSRLRDYRDLGMSPNDTIGANNYFVLNHKQNAMKGTNGYELGVENGELISIDNDHATYYTPMSPRISGIHKELPNGIVGMFF